MPMIANLFRLPENIISELEIEIEVAEGIEFPMSLQEKLDWAINDEIAR